MIKNALLQDILENPTHDTPRLIYADWIEEYEGNESRADFIRTQIEFTNKFLKGHEVYALYVKCKALHKAHASSWVGPEEWWQQNAAKYYNWQRGWLNTAVASGRDKKGVPAPTRLIIEDLLKKTPLTKLEATLACHRESRLHDLTGWNQLQTLLLHNGATETVQNVSTLAKYVERLSLPRSTRYDRWLIPDIRRLLVACPNIKWLDVESCNDPKTLIAPGIEDVCQDFGVSFFNVEEYR